MIARFLFQSPGAIFHCVVDHGLWCMVYFREQKNLLAVILVPKNDFTSHSWPYQQPASDLVSFLNPVS